MLEPTSHVQKGVVLQVLSCLLQAGSDRLRDEGVDGRRVEVWVAHLQDVDLHRSQSRGQSDTGGAAERRACRDQQRELACLAVLLPPLLPLATVPVDWLCRLLVLVVQAFAELPMAQWQLGRPTPVLVLLLSLALLALVLPALGRRWRLLGLGLLVVAGAVHLSLLGADQLLLVHQGRLDLLVARHRGRAALVSSSADGFSCSQASQLARGLGVQRFDWALLLDPLAPEQPDCWRAQAGLVLASADGSLPLQPGQRLASEGLSAAPVAIETFDVSDK